ncbi:MAG: ABC transporter permease [Eubacterium sp.]|nr:ABC transporter permease [Eubacterium sp.]
MKSSFMRLWRADTKRASRLIPSVFITALIFALTAGLLLVYSEDLIYSKESFAAVSVGMYMPEQSSENDSAMNFAKNMDSIKESAEIVEVKSLEEGKQLVKDGKITALIIFPENFINSLYGGDAEPIKVLFNENMSLEEHLVNDMIYLASEILGVAQTAYRYYNIILKDISADDSLRGKLTDDLDNRNLSYVASRNLLFDIQNINSSTSHNLRETLTASFIFIILMLMCFQITGFYKSYNTAFMMRQIKEGGGAASMFFSRLLSGSMILYNVYLLIFVLLLAAGTKPNFLSLITMIPVVVLSAAITLFASMLFKSEHLANGALFILTILVVYLAGGLIPLILMPKFLQTAAAANPFTYLLKYILWSVY